VQITSLSIHHLAETTCFDNEHRCTGNHLPTFNSIGKRKKFFPFFGQLLNIVPGTRIVGQFNHPEKTKKNFLFFKISCSTGVSIFLFTKRSFIKSTVTIWLSLILKLLTHDFFLQILKVPMFTIFCRLQKQFKILNLLQKTLWMRIPLNYLGKNPRVNFVRQICID